jgi:1,5-anhydro-D-fructose reductase (1,5-anhydro-D-mannitol-forming)
VTIRWGMIGCGDVTEVKSGPGFQKAAGSALVAVTRRDRARAEDFARRHGVPVVHASADALIDDPAVDAVYIATPPGSHCDLACRVAARGKPCLVEKPMAPTHAECLRMVQAFADAAVPLWVAYYRRALPRFLLIRDLLQGGSVGPVTSIHIDVREPLTRGEGAAAWRFNRSVAGGGLFYDKGSHCVDLVDFLFGPIERVSALSGNTGGAYEVEDLVAAVFQTAQGVTGTGTWNFNSGVPRDAFVLTTADGEISTSFFSDADVILSREGTQRVYETRNPPHVHQPLIQSIVDELAGRGPCESTGVSGARASRVLELCTAPDRAGVVEISSP